MGHAHNPEGKIAIDFRRLGKSGAELFLRTTQAANKSASKRAHSKRSATDYAPVLANIVKHCAVPARAKLAKRMECAWLATALDQGNSRIKTP